jgi:hypothetical protein
MLTLNWPAVVRIDGCMVLLPAGVRKKAARNRGEINRVLRRARIRYEAK